MFMVSQYAGDPCCRMACRGLGRTLLAYSILCAYHIACCVVYLENRREQGFIRDRHYEDVVIIGRRLWPSWTAWNWSYWSEVGCDVGRCRGRRCQENAASSSSPVYDLF